MMVRISGKNFSRKVDDDMILVKSPLLERETVAADLTVAGELNTALMLSDSQQRRGAVR